MVNGKKLFEKDILSSKKIKEDPESYLKRYYEEIEEEIFNKKDLFETWQFDEELCKKVLTLEIIFAYAILKEFFNFVWIGEIHKHKEKGKEKIYYKFYSLTPKTKMKGEVKEFQIVSKENYHKLKSTCSKTIFLHWIAFKAKFKADGKREDFQEILNFNIKIIRDSNTLKISLSKRWAPFSKEKERIDFFEGDNYEKILEFINKINENKLEKFIKNTDAKNIKDLIEKEIDDRKKEVSISKSSNKNKQNGGDDMNECSNNEWEFIKELSGQDTSEPQKQEPIYLYPDYVQSFILSLQAKPFVILAGVSGTGKTQLARRWVEYVAGKQKENNENGKNYYAFVPVRPNWRDAKDVFGYYNPITKVFYPTDFLKVLIKAWKNYVEVLMEKWEKDEDFDFIEANNKFGEKIKKELQKDILNLAVNSEKAENKNTKIKQYYAILDEMNLARVEYYFSDILSTMESPGETFQLHTLDNKLAPTQIEGSSVEEGVDIEKAPLYKSLYGMQIKKGKLAKSHEEEYLKYIPARISFPPNLFIIGTVNIDETTQSFSPKVLDRAFVIELREMHPKVMLDTGNENIDCNSCNRSVKGYKKEINDFIKDLEQIFKDTHLVFGPRVKKEIEKFTLADKSNENKPEDKNNRKNFKEVINIVINGQDFCYFETDWGSNDKNKNINCVKYSSFEQFCLDNVLVSKILTKVRGTDEQIGYVLKKLYYFCKEGKVGNQKEIDDGKKNDKKEWELISDNKCNYVFPKAAKKIWLMLKELDTTGHTSFFS